MHDDIDECVEPEAVQEMRAERDLRKSEKRYYGLLSVIPDIVYNVDPDGHFTFLNDSVRLLGYESEELLGKHFSAILHPDDVSSVSRADVLGKYLGKKTGDENAPKLFDERRTGRRCTRDLEVRLLAKPRADSGDAGSATREMIGLIFSYGDVNASGHYDGAVRDGRDPNRKLLGTVGIIRDITKRKRIEEEREKLKARLYQADKMATVGLLSAGIAHEINNPISFVLPNLQSLEKSFELLQRIFSLYENDTSRSEIARFRKEHGLDVLLPETAQMLSDCLDGTRRVRDIVRELRHFSRMDDTAQRLDLSELVDSCLAFVSNEFKYKARVFRRYADIPPVAVNRSKMSQAFLNIIVNAAQAIEEGRPGENWIRVATGQEDDRVFVEISNSGEPILPDVLPRIFDPFFSTKPEGRCTGLGLSIAFHNVQQHGGHIEVESGDERGTVFRVWLPMDTGLKIRPASAAETRTAVEKTIEGGRILVIDDEKGILRYMRIVLDRRYSVVTANGGREALDILSRDRDFDAVLCDLMMPDISGMAVFEEVEREYPELAGRFVFITGGAFTPRAIEFVRKVRNPTIEKPIANEKLLEVVGSVVGRLD